MSDPYVGEIRTVGFNFAPTGWAMCNGQLLPISQNTALFSLLGTNYGGNGTSTFALPDLNGSIAIGQGDGPGLTPRLVGELGGEPSVTLLTSEMPVHTHSAMGASTLASTGDATNDVWAEPRYGRAARPAYAPAASANVDMGPTALGVAGGGLPHNNMPPFLGVYFVIALQGVFPPRG